MTIIDRIARPSWIERDLEAAMKDIRAGRAILLTDRNGTTCLFVSAQAATPDAITFMATQGRGLVCLALTQDRADALGLTLQPRHGNGSRPRYAVSIEARTGVTTGISAHDRAATIAVAMNPDSEPADLVSPGHVFPVIATTDATGRDFGHCEALTELTRMAGEMPGGVFCTVLDDAGEVAGPAYIAAFALRHELSIVPVSAIAARLDRQRAVQAMSRLFDTGWGPTEIAVGFGGHVFEAAA